MSANRLVSGFVTVGVWTLLSRLLGFVRDIMIAAFLGSGPVAEAFLIAFSLPNMFRRFFAEGAFNMAFVPMFSKRYQTGDDPEGFAQNAFSAMWLILTGFTALGMVLMPALVYVMASGFADDDRFGLAVFFGRITFPYILFISLTALLSGVLNATGRFMAAAAAPVLLNVVFIVPLALISLTSHPFAWTELQIGSVLAWAVPVAGVAQMALVWVAAGRAGYRLQPGWPKLTPELRRLVIIAAPAALAGGVVQINLLIGRQVASFFEGAVAWLNYADRLYQLPLGVVAVAVGVVLLPELSRRLGAGDEIGGQDAFNRASELSLSLTIPAAVALMVIPYPLVSVLYQRGAFGADDVTATALAVAVYGLGLPAFVLQKALQPLYFAREDTKRPFYYALASLAVNAGIAIGLAPLIGFIAAAVGTTLAAWVMVLQLWLGSRGMGLAASLDARFRRRIWRIIAASALMGAVLQAATYLLAPFFAAGSVRYLALMLLVIAGMVSYGIIGHAMGAFRLSEYRRALTRRR